MMRDIDWSKAPEGFDFFIPWIAGEGRFYRDGGGRYLGVDGGYAEKEDLKRLAINVICRPWTGEGPPPVGTACEVHDGGASWSGHEEWIGLEVKVHHVFKNTLGQDLVVVESGTGGCACFVAECLRPIRTLEQIAAEERDAAINEMCSLAAERITLSSAAILYDAGYRKQK